MINILLQANNTFLLPVKYVLTAASIRWNNSPLTLRYLYDDPLTKQGGLVWQNNQCQYSQTLPDFLKLEFPMLGTKDISTSNGNTLELPEKTLVYMLRSVQWKLRVNMDGWIDTGYSGIFLSCDKTRPVSIYAKVFNSGRYIIDNKAAMYLFSTSGIFIDL